MRGASPRLRPVARREPPARVTVENGNGPRATVVPRLPGIAHVILAVEDGGSPALTSYRRVILSVKPAP